MIQNDNPSPDQNFAHIPMSEQDFEQVYKDYWKKVFGIIHYYTRDSEISTELTQELFATIWEKRKTLMIQKNIGSYLLRAAKLEAFDYIRTDVRRKEILEKIPQHQPQNITLDTLYYNELRDQVHVVISALPPRCQEVYSLSQYDGLNNSTIAARLLISEKTVEYHLYKAMSILRESLSMYNN